jgi:putative endonuclease
MSSNIYYVYIETNKIHTVFYTGMTNDLGLRHYQHKNKINNSFTSKYNINKLIYYEMYQDVHDAIVREKQIKDYRREKKIDLIKTINPLFTGLID